ncbi:Crp/Fnr family transcriptional regulator [Neobacillus sp. SM06]|uniref:Crp/Fnr family transcriptional regulator n=1 Tax=Neobacillus sp. SM06 TaxID=3422492 RepID=UPI003D2D0224
MIVQKYSETVSFQLNELLKSSGRTIFAEKGTFLFSEGQPAKEMYIIRNGKIMISKVNSDGKELGLRLCQTNDMVGELTLFTENPTYFFNAKVLENTEVAAIDIETLEQELFQNSKLAMEYLKWMNDHFRRTITKFRDLVLLGKKGALYSTLIRLCNSYGILQEDGIFIHLQLSSQELANLCGIARETVSRMLTDLRDLGIISVKRKMITVHHVQYLKNEIHCENCPVEFCNIK